MMDTGGLFLHLNLMAELLRIQLPTRPHIVLCRLQNRIIPPSSSSLREIRFPSLTPRTAAIINQGKLNEQLKLVIVAEHSRLNAMKEGLLVVPVKKRDPIVVTATLPQNSGSYSGQ